MKKYYKGRKKRNSVSATDLFVLDCLIVIGTFLLIITMIDIGYIEVKSFIHFCRILIVVGLVATIIKIFFIYIKKQHKKLEYGDIRKIDNMTGGESEEYLKAHFEKQGYKVNTTPNTNDYGADLVLSKNDERIVVQAKRYKGKVNNEEVQVNNEEVQKFLGALDYHKAEKGIVIVFRVKS